jgi:hypothetical protein
MQNESTDALKAAINYVAALLGIGTFLGFVNLVVGLLSAGWIVIQIYGYLVHELPMKQMRNKLMRLELLKASADQPSKFSE